MYILSDLKKIVENQDLYRNEDDCGFFIQIFFYFFNVKDFIFTYICACEMYILADRK